jgi:hypothetical protein
MRYLKKYERLGHETYQSAADQLRKLGHVERPKELMDWADRKRSEWIKDSFKMGEYSMDFFAGSRKFSGKFKINLEIKFDREFDIALNEWMDPESGSEIWLRFKVIVIPADEETIETLQTMDPQQSRLIFSNIDGYPSKVMTYTLNSYLNINLSLSKSIIDKNIMIVRDVAGTVQRINKYYYNDASKIKRLKTIYGDVGDGELLPSGDIVFNNELSWNCSQFSRITNSYKSSTVFFSDRKSALKFKNDLRAVFGGDIVVGKKPGNPGGVKEIVMDELCSERDISFDEFERFIKSIDIFSINSLYKD